MVDMRDDTLATPRGSGEPIGATDPRLDPAMATPRADTPADRRSLIDDVEALIHDAKTYLDAELSYQKTRAAFVSDRLKKAVAYGLVAATVAFVAFIGLTVGLIIALTPLITGWGATAVVVGAMALVVFLLLKRAASNWQSLMGAVREESPGPGGSEAEGHS